MKWRRNRPQPVTEAETVPLRAAAPDSFTAPLPVIHSRRVTPFRAGIVALGALAVAGTAALALVTVPAGPALGAQDALRLPATVAGPVTYADPGSPVLDKAQRTAALSQAVARADTLAAHRAHQAHLAHLAVLARKAAQAKAAAAAAAHRQQLIAQQLITEHATAKKARSVAPAPVSAGPSSGGSSSSSGTVTATSAFQACVIQRESGGNSQVMNASGHYGLYQFSYSTWVAAGGAGSLFGHASAAYQTQVFWKAYALWGVSPWRPYDGC